MYDDALRKSGYTEKVKLGKVRGHRHGRKTRRRPNITWFTPPFSKNVTTNHQANLHIRQQHIV